MPRNRTTGPARMKDLGYVKVEVHLSKKRAAELKKYAKELKLPVATLARRWLVSVIEAGDKIGRVCASERYN